MDGWMDGWVDGWIHGWMGLMNGWIDRWTTCALYLLSGGGGGGLVPELVFIETAAFSARQARTARSLTLFLFLC